MRGGYRLQYDNTKWTLRELKYICKKEKPTLSTEELDEWAAKIYKELNSLNNNMHYSDRVYNYKNIPFSEHYAHDKYSNYFDEENEF